MNVTSEKFDFQSVMNKKACANCFHSVEEHDISKCYALDFDGNTYQSCKCTNLSFELKIRVNVPDISLSNGNSI